MFRQSLLPCACLTLALGLTLAAALACAFPASAQERSPYERLDRLERDLNMLQRHIYRGASAPIYAPDGASAVNTQLRMDRLEAEMRDLTGRIEEYANRLEQLRRRVEQLTSEAEPRPAQGSGPGAPGPLAAAPLRPGSAAPPRPIQPPAAVERGSRDGEGGPTPLLGTLTPPGTPPGTPPRTPPGTTLTPPARPNELASMATPPAAAEGALPGGSATERYNYAFGLMKEAKYPAAETAFREFIAAHPRDQMAGNAQYWLGETYYARGRYMEAASAFAEGYKRYPKSSKAPDALLKLGMSLARADQKQNACVALARLGEEFPKAAASVRQRAASEMKNLGC